MKPDSAKEIKTSLYWIIAIAVLVLFVGVLVAGLVLYRRMDLCYILLVIILQAFKKNHKMNADKLCTCPQQIHWVTSGQSGDLFELQVINYYLLCLI